MEYEKLSGHRYEQAIPFFEVPNNNLVIGVIIDTKGFNSLDFIIGLSNFTEGAYTVTIEDGDDSGLSDAAPVAISDDPQTLVPATAENLTIIANGVTTIAYIGKKRFVRATITPNGVSTFTALTGVMAQLGVALNSANPAGQIAA